MKKRKKSSTIPWDIQWRALGTDKLEAIGKVVDLILGANGVICQTLANSEHRVQQVDMAKILSTVLVKAKQTCIIEAPTGSGKSLAYLVPSVPASFMKTEPIIISTSTKNLQTQLSDKDLPMLKQIFSQHFGVDFSYAVCKGRGNYLCIRRLFRMLDLQSSKKKKKKKKGKNVELELFDEQDELNATEAMSVDWQIAEKRNQAKIAFQTKEEREAFDLLLDWYMSNPVIGDTYEFGQEVGKGAMSGIWQRVCGDADECLGWRCDYADRCYFVRAKKEWEKAQICIVNHSLFFANKMVESKGGTPTLPKSNVVIFDEADHVAEAAKKFQGTEITSSWFGWMGSRLTTHTSEKGCLRDIIVAQAGGNVTEGLRLILGHINGLISCGTEFFQKVEKEVFVDDSRGYIKRYKKPLAADCGKLIEFLDFFISLACDAREWHKRAKDDVKEKEASSIEISFSHYKSELLKVTRALRLQDECYFVEKKGKAAALEGCSQIKLKSVPIDISSFLRSVTKDMHCVYTSATLASDSGLKYFGETIGVDVSSNKVVTAILPSPFNYAANCRIYTPDMPSPKMSVEFNKKTGEQVLEIEPFIDGGIFVLFTAYSSMMEVVNVVRPILESRGRQVFVQGIDGVKDKIVNRFRVAQNAVLFGVSSFWVGVDIQGKALSCVIIVKMPFERPDDPINEATKEYLELHGKSYFKDYDLPKATMMIRQGFGRLIRTRNDRGIVVILDPRLNEWSQEKKFYAQSVMKSLPMCKQVRNIIEIEHFMLKGAKP